MATGNTVIAYVASICFPLDSAALEITVNEYGSSFQSTAVWEKYEADSVQNQGWGPGHVVPWSRASKNIFFFSTSARQGNVVILTDSSLNLSPEKVSFLFLQNNLTTCP